MQNQHPKYPELLELINRYPSPHNGQPMVLQGDGVNLTVSFETQRGLQATPISYLFSFVTIGVFIRYVELCCKALGHAINVDLQLPGVHEMAAKGVLTCGAIEITYDAAERDDALREAILFRQTSRKKYHTGLSGEEKSSVQSVADGHGLQHHFMDASAAHHTIWLNQRAVFDDMFDPAVRHELGHWLRFDHDEKVTKKDGLSYDCMELSGSALRFAIDHYKVLRWPIVAPLLQQYYLRTMKDASDVGYVQAPFESENDAYEIGRCVIDVWIELSRHGKYLHPFGTIVSNDQAHADFVRMAGITEESRKQNYVVFIYRAGESDVPVKSERIDIQTHLMKGES